MNTLHEHSIEPLTDAAWQRIEDKLFAQLAAQPAAVSSGGARPRARAYLPWAAAALAAACALLGVTATWLGWPAAPPSAAERFSTSASTQRFVLEDMTLRLDPDSSVTLLRGPDSAVTCTLERGTARFEVAKRNGRAPLAVLADEVRVEVVGTVFSVARAGTRVVVETYEGTVRVSARGESTLVQRGEHWPAARAPSSETASATRDLRAESAAETASPGAHEPRSESAAQAAPPGASESRSESAAKHRASSAHEPRSGSAAQAAAGRATAPGAAEARRGGVRSAAASLDASRAASARTRFEEAAACEASDAGKAMRLYEQLARESGSWASNSLFALGRLELERGMAHKGEHHLRRYLRLYPSGPNAVDARDLLARMARELTP